MKALDLTKGTITKTLLQFALPMILGNLLQQMYNVTDTLIVGRFIGREALAAVGSAYALMTFLNSILLGFCMGSGVMFSVCYGKRDFDRMKQGMFLSFVMIGVLTLLINGSVFAGLDGILLFLRVPEQVYGQMREYLWIIFWGITAIFVYNYFASLLELLLHIVQHKIHHILRFVFLHYFAYLMTLFGIVHELVNSKNHNVNFLNRLEPKQIDFLIHLQ